MVTTCHTQTSAVHHRVGICAAGAEGAGQGGTSGLGGSLWALKRGCHTRKTQEQYQSSPFFKNRNVEPIHRWTGYHVGKTNAQNKDISFQ